MRSLTSGLIFFFITLIFAPPIRAADVTPPQTEVFFSPEVPSGNNGWYIQAVDVKLVATDLESGVAAINYKLNDAPWQNEGVLSSLNLIQNPSFEVGNYWWISKWSHPNYPWWKASLRQDFLVAKFGAYSARIFSYSNGTYYWTNEDYYAVTVPFKVYYVGAWLKTLDFFGAGGYYKVWAKRAAGSDLLLAESEHLSGTEDWTLLSTSFYMPEGYEGVYVQLIGQGFGFIWWDGVDLHEEQEASFEFTVTENGDHELLFYSIDRAEVANVEDIKGPANFKIDTNAPADWRLFEGVRQMGYNDHTFDVSVTVSDYSSGLDINTGFYSYSADGGAVWSDWLPIDKYTPAEDGVKDVQITAERVDFINSNWAIEKLIQFKISDMAGLESYSPVMALNAPWVKLNGGDIYARSGIDFAATPLEPQATGLAISSGLIEGLTTSSGWLMENYYVQEREKYTGLLPAEEPTPLSDIGNKLPTESGVYIIGRSFIINEGVIPAGFESVPNLAAVVFVDGDLSMNSDLLLQETSALVFVVSGDVKIKHDVERVDASFLVDGELDTRATPGASKQLTINGMLIADSYRFSRMLKHSENQNTPAEIVNYAPKNLFIMADLLGEARFTWEEKRKGN